MRLSVFIVSDFEIICNILVNINILLVSHMELCS
jgi:hypothetical protein